MVSLRLSLCEESQLRRFWLRSFLPLTAEKEIFGTTQNLGRGKGHMKHLNLRNRGVKSILTLSALTAMLFGLAFGQENKGKILGTVTDASGGVIPGVKLSAVSDILPTPVITMSDSAGRYVFEAVPPGTYSVTAIKEGFQTLKQANVSVRVGSLTDLNVRLTVGAVAQTVEVSEAAQSLDVTSARVATNITRAELDKLPAGRSFNSLLLLLWSSALRFTMGSKLPRRR